MSDTGTRLQLEVSVQQKLQKYFYSLMGDRLTALYPI